MPKKIFDVVRRIAGDKAYRTGIESFRRHAVLDTSIGIRSISARVANEQGRFERVRLRWPNLQLEAQCSCSWHRTPFCRHVVAVILEGRRKYAQIDEALTNRDKAGRGYFKDSSSFSQLPESGENDSEEKGEKPRGHKFKTSSSTPESLRDLLLQYSSEAAVSLTLKGEPPFLETKWQKLEVTVSLHYKSRTYSGSNIKTLVETGRGSGGMRFNQFSTQEQQAMRHLLACSHSATGATFTLDAHDVADLFHILTDFPRMFCDTGRLLINRAMLEPALLIRKEKDYYRLVPRFNMPQHGLMPSRDLRFAVGRGGVWLATAGVYWWVPGFTDINWLRAFVRGQSFHLTSSELEKLRAEQERQTLPFRFYPADQIKELKITRSDCVPVISLDWLHEGISAEVDFQYGDKRVGAESPAVIWQETGFIIRNFSEEQRAVNRLKKTGFKDRKAPGESIWFVLNSPKKILQFIDRLNDNFKDNWRVFYTNRFAEIRQKSGVLQLDIKTAAEGEAWFELQVIPLMPTGEAVNLRKLLRAVEQEKDCLVLPDGAVLKVPERTALALKSLNGRAVKVKEEADTFHFGYYAAFPVNAVLKKYTAFYDRGKYESEWQRVCRRLEKSLTEDVAAIPASLQNILRDYQKNGVVWLQRLHDCGFHGILADEMGLGKTIQALALMLARYQNNDHARPSLVVCPTSLTENWLNEVSRFTPQLKAVVITGSERLPKIKEIDKFHLAITSYALLRRDVDYYKEINFEYLILDEAQHIKNPRTANSKTSKVVSARYRCILTGTPLENNLRELWSLFDFLMPGMLGTKSFFQQYYEKQSEDQVVADELLQQVKPFIMRRNKEQVCRELPPKQEQVLYSDLYPAQRQLYDYLLADSRKLLTEVKQNQWSKKRFQCLTLLMRLRQVCDLPDLLPAELKPQDGSMVPSAKMDLLREIVYEALDSGRRILLFSQFKKVLEYIAAWLGEEEIAYEYLDGATTNRLERVNRFNSEPAIPLFLISLKAGGTGLNLTGADTVIHYDQWWNPMVEDQATDRSHRIGQDKTVTVMKFAARNTIEEKIVQLQEHKRELFQQIMAGSYDGAGELTPEDFEFLLEP